MSSARVSMGLAGSLGAEFIGELAPHIEEAGFSALWVNDTPGGDAVAALAAAARATDHLRLATGVIPVDRRSAASIADAVEEAGLPQERVLVGIGSGAGQKGALARVRDAADTLRERLRAPVVVGALGPRMRRLAAVHADGVLLNWVSPGEAARQRAALSAEAPNALVALYVRTALDPAAFARLRDETARYASSPHYAANFARMGVDASETVIEGVEALRGRAAAYTAPVDELVLRAVTAEDSPEAYRAFIRAAAPGHEE